MGEGLYRARDQRGTQGEQYSIVLGGSSWEGGENNILIIFSRFKYVKKILRMPRRPTHCDEVAGAGGS